MVNHLDIFHCYTNKRKLQIPSLKDIKGVINTFLFSRALAEVQDSGLVINLGAKKIKNIRNHPFFLFLHLWDVHNPYFCPKKLRTYNGRNSKKILHDRYLGSVRYADRQLGRFFNFLKNNNIFDDTIVIVTSDHGESLTEHDIFFDHHGLYDETTHVPLIIRYPRRFSEGKKVRGFIQHVDLLPTILDILNIGQEEYQLDGKNLIPLVKNSRRVLRPFVYMEESYVQQKRAIRTKKYKYIEAKDGVGYCRYCHKVHAGVEELYDLQKDPSEKNNVANQNPAMAKELKSKMNNFVNELVEKRKRDIQIAGTGKHSADDIDKDEEKKVMKKLRSLGYMD
jgi:arylsulfatase A-like enzyme